MKPQDTITKEMYQIVDSYAYEPNDAATRVTLKNELYFYLKCCVDRREIYDYMVVCDETNNSQAMISNKILHADVYIANPLNIHVAYETTVGQRLCVVAAFCDFSIPKEIDYMAITREIAGG